MGRAVKLIVRVEGSDEAAEQGIDENLLKSEFFQVKLERWQSSDTPAEISLDLPPNSSAEKGSLLFLRRLADDSEADWSSFKWWQEAGFEETSLFPALYLFDQVLMEDICKEITSALKRFLVACPEPYLGIGKKYQEDLRAVKIAPPNSISVDSAVLENMLFDAMDSGGDMQHLVDRAIGGSSDEVVEKALIEAWSRFSDNNAESVHWLTEHLEAFMRVKAPAVSFACRFSKDSMFKSDERRVKMSRVLRSYFELSLSKLVVDHSEGDIWSFHDWTSLLDTFESLPQNEFRWDPDFFVALPFSLQHYILEKQHLGKSRSTRQLLNGRVQIVPEMARHLLLEHTSYLSPDDKTFLSKADFPGLD